jgi:hypothetical protein
MRGSVSIGVNGIVWPLGGVVVVYYGWWGFRSMSKILLGVTVESSLNVGVVLGVWRS